MEIDYGRGRFNTDTEAGYAPVEGELLGIASALHKTRYFVSGHPKVTVITDHKPILNLLQDRSRTINNKRLTNLRRKCDGFIFKIGYGRGIDNTADAISRIKDWNKDPKADKERMDSVSDHHDIDDDSPEIYSCYQTEVINRSDLDEVIIEVSCLKTNKYSDASELSNAILGSWNTTPSIAKLDTLLKMYGRGGWDEDNAIFTAEITQLDRERDFHYSSKIDVANCHDNIYEDQHEVCSVAGYGHASEEDMSKIDDSGFHNFEKLKNRTKDNCFVLNVKERKFYSLSWQAIADAANEDEFLLDLKNAMKTNNVKKMENLLKNRKIKDDDSENHLAGIKIEDLSLYRDVIMVQDRIWAPSSIIFSFFNNLHLGHRSVDMMMRLATRSVYWSGMKKDLTDFFNECYECNHSMRKNKTLPDLPEDETTKPFECVSIDIFETFTKEHALAIIDRHTGYVWCRKTGDKKQVQPEKSSKF